MAKQSREWTEILVKRGVVGPDQISEARKMGNTPVEDALVKLGYMPITNRQFSRAVVLAGAPNFTGPCSSAPDPGALVPISGCMAVPRLACGQPRSRWKPIRPIGTRAACRGCTALSLTISWRVTTQRNSSRPVKGGWICSPTYDR